jgi:starch-binding outer membrane protein, SusD/RagB family
MKFIKIYLYFFLAAFVITACKKKLVEDPQSILTPVFFSTTQGFQQGLDAAYAGNRMFWGNQDLFTLTVIGTDEFYSGVDAGGNANLNAYNSLYTASSGQILNIWRPCYTYINTCNGVIDNAPNVNLDAATKNRMVGEAKFLRANYYFVLVQLWGDVTLNKNFQTVPSTSAKRDPMADVYNFIIQDLKDAIAVLPASPKTNNVLPGKATAAAARHLLAKVYLTRAGSSAKQASDYQDAYNTAKALIDSRSSLGLTLLPDFKNVFAEGVEDNAEVLWSVQHTPNLAYNGSANQNSSGPDNVLNHMWVPQYERRPGMVRSTEYGRPYIRCVPTLWLTDTIFKERVNDSRYDKTFQTVWFANNPVSPGNYPRWGATLPAGAPPGAVPNGLKFKFGDTAIYMPGRDTSDAAIARTPHLLIPPRKYDNTLSPAMKKYFDTKRPDLNAPSIRPVIVYRLAETYLIAAEAAFMSGQLTDAVTYINAVRERAAYPSGNAVAMRITTANLNLDFILDERSRELCGENIRWLDLVRTGQLLNRVRAHNAEARPNIQDKHILRPIPQAQIDAVVTGEKYGQNTGW